MMNMQERMLAVVRGEWHDRVPFVQYSGITSPDDDAVVRDAVGPENIGFLQWTQAHRADAPNCRFEMERIEANGTPGFRRTLHTPVGSLFEERLEEPTLGTTANARHFVQSIEDYTVLLAYLRDLTIEPDPSALRDTWAVLGDSGLPHVSVGRTPYQQLWIEWVDINDLIPHMCERPDLMEEVMEEMARVQTEILKAVCTVAKEEPIPHIDFADNITAPMIGNDLFRRYCLRAYDELADMLDAAGLDIPVMVHMDGDLKALWPDIGASRVRGLDSMSPPPDNDTSVADAQSLWPEMRLLINFPSSVHLSDPDVIYQKALDILEEGGRQGRLQIQISENVPPGAWRHSYPAIIQAIDDFGAACA